MDDGLEFHTYLLYSREGDAEESLGSPSDPSFSPVSWSISGKYLAGALEKMVNIWQVNRKRHINTSKLLKVLFLLAFYVQTLASLHLESHNLFTNCGNLCIV